MYTNTDYNDKDKKVLVIKRDGQMVPYDGTKIINAIQKANATVPPIRRLSDAKVSAIEERIFHMVESPVSVETIQDKVEIGIMEMRGYEVAQNYIRYRYKRNLERAAQKVDSYVYIEYNDNDVSEKLIQVSPDINTLKKYLKERVEKYFNCSWDRIEKKYFTADDEFTDTFVKFDNSNDILTWEILKCKNI